ncbi:MAG: hypothetical protein R3C10_09390 [Pirellulales bacterium]
MRPFGQTFTAVDEHITRIEVYLDDYNNQYYNGSTILRLYEGDEIAGEPFFVDGQMVGLDSQGPVSFNTLPVVLTVGQTYTFEVDRFNHAGGGHQSTSIRERRSHTGPRRLRRGHAIFNGQAAPHYDLAFRVIPLVVGDANVDGLVDGTDYVYWAINFGDNPADDPPGAPSNGDLNYDGRVDGTDYIVWALAYQKAQGSITVPEPSSFWLAAAVASLPAFCIRSRTAVGRAEKRST